MTTTDTSLESQPRPGPAVTELGEPYWAQAREGVLVIQACGDCNTVFFPPRPICPGCWSSNVAWREATGRGRLESFSVVHRPPSPAFAADVPYAVALVRLDEGPRMMANVIDCEVDALEVDMAVQVVFARYEDVVLPQFTPVKS